MIESLKDKVIRLRDLIDNGVIVDDATTTYVDDSCVISSGVHLEPNVIIKGNSVIAYGATIGANSILNNAHIGVDTKIKCSMIEDSAIGDNSTVGPFAYIRNNANIGANCRIGDFVEIKNARLDDGVKASHLAYIGDATVGAKTNVGCGTVFANYNGVTKQKTIVGANVFIGANTNLVAPIRVGDKAYIAAGSTVTQDVPTGSLCIARERQIIKNNWTDIRH